MPQDNAADGFSLERFEFLAYTGEKETAARELIKLLEGLDNRYGEFDIKAILYATNASDQTAHLLTRITSAVTTLFSNSEFSLSPQGFSQIIAWQRWLSSLFAASPFGNADHILRSLSTNGTDAGLEVTALGFAKFCMLYTPDSEVPINLDVLWEYDRGLAAALFLVLLSPRFLGTTAAHNKRERLLAWLPGKLTEFEHLEQLPSGILHDVYMHCSYADLPEKHDIKKAINPLIRNTLIREGVLDVVRAPDALHASGKPVMIVVLEYFSVNHSIYRTHSSTLLAARENFHLVGLGMKQYVDDAGRAVFHEFVDLEGGAIDAVRQVRKTALEKNAGVLYMPSVGMFQLTMFLSNLRLAPLQLIALGHPATTHSPHIDYVVVEEDYVGDPACFSEKLLVLPDDALPYIPSAAASSAITPIFRTQVSPVKIAVCATTMKLNPKFLWACAAITRQAVTPVEFHFLVGFAQGLVGIQVEQILKQYLGPYVKVYKHQPYPQYMEVIRHCDMFLNPFPFGNTNGIVDTVSAGLVGVCRTGREVHEHIDEGMFARLGLPSWMVTDNTESYVAAAVRLVDNEAERLALRHELVAKNSVQRLFTGRPEIFSQRVIELLAQSPAEPTAA